MTLLRPAGFGGPALRLHLLLATATFARVFLLAFQNQNVIGGHYLWAAATTAGINVTDAAMVLLVVRNRWRAVPPMTAGATLGVLAAMWVHRHVFGAP